MMPDFNDASAALVKEYLLSGEPLTQLESAVLFGVPGVHRIVSDLRRLGFRIIKRRVTYALAMRRINEVASLRPPADLPIREVRLIEYRVQS